MSVAKALAARAITFLLDGLQGPTNRESREILEQALADSELRREREVREATEHRTALEAANARAEKAEARIADRVCCERDELRAKVERLCAIGVYVSDDGTIVDVRDIPPTGSRIATLEADLAAALARIAELEATVEELHIIGHYAQCAAANASPPEAVRAGIRAVAERVRRERCLIARAVAANIDVRVAEDQGGGFLVAAHRAGEDEDVERNVPAAEVPATLARLLDEGARDDFRGLIRMAVKNRIWFEIGSDNVWVGTDHYPHGEDVDTAIAILERELRERAIRYGAAAGAAKKGA